MSSNNSTAQSSIFSIFSKVSIGLAAATFIYAIYFQFFYVEEAWVDGTISLIWSFLASLLWLIIFLIFRILLNKRLNYRKANAVINLYLFFSFVSLIFIAQLLYNTLSFYFSLEDGISIDQMVSTVNQSISGAILTVIATYTSYLLKILIGIRFTQIKSTESKLFSILGWTLITSTAFDIYDTFSTPDLAAVALLINVGILCLMGILFKKVNRSQVSFEVAEEVTPLTPKKKEPEVQKVNPSLKPIKPEAKKDKPVPKKVETTRKEIKPKSEQNKSPKTSFLGRKSKKTEPEIAPVPMDDLDGLRDIE